LTVLYIDRFVVIRDTLCWIAAGTKRSHSGDGRAELELDFAVAVDNARDQRR